MRIKTFFSVPVFDGNKEKTNQAALLSLAWWAVIPAPVVMLIGNAVEKRTPVFVNSLNIVFLIVWFFVRYLMLQGAIKEGALIALLAGMTVITATSIGLGTVRTPAVLGYMPMILFAGFFFGRKGIAHTVIIVSLLILGLILAERNNLLKEPDYTVGLMQWIAYSAFLAITGHIALLFYSTSQKNLRQAQKEIIKRQKTESSLKIFLHMAEQSPVSIMTANSEGLIEYVNPKFIEITGYTFEESYHQNPRIVQSGLHSPSFYENLWETILAGKNWYGVFQNKKKNGDLYWEKASISPIFDADNKITHFVAVKEDITQQREAERKLQEHVKQIEDLQKTLKQQALRDPLTDLYNRRYLNEILKQEFPRAERENYPISIILIDLDHLKEINDLGGHATGDYALRVLAAQLRILTRRADTVCRQGGDEFAIIMPKTTSKDAFARTLELHKKMKEITLLHKAGQTLRITFSAGIATYPMHGENSRKILDHADEALYLAKRKGRNRVELFSVE